MTDAADNRSDEAGFTLVELLVAMALLGLLSLLLLNGLRFGIESWKQTTGHLQGTDEVQLVRHVLQRLVGQAYPLVTTTDQGRPVVAFEGTPDRLVFLSRPPSAFAEGGLVEVTLRAEASGHERRLELAVRPELPADPDAPAADEKLLSGLASLSFSYFGAIRPDEPATWHDEWMGQPGLPGLVRISGQFAPGDPRIWPGLVILPRISVDQGCMFDPLTRRCRGR